MAVFLINICKFNGCGTIFPSLGDLIHHIENTHIDYDPQIIEQKEQQQPACLPLSYVLRFITDAARKEGACVGTSEAELKRKSAINHHSYSMSSSNRSNTPTGSEIDDDELMISDSEDSNDSWTTEEFSSAFIMRYGSRHSVSSSNGGSATNEKPFACPVPGCKKRYKNVNGIKYHSKNGHKKEGKVRKGYKCHCGKSYKMSQGLKNHSIFAHGGASPDPITSPNSISTTPSPILINTSNSSNSNCSINNNNNNSNCLLNNNNNNNILSTIATTQTTSFINGNSDNATTAIATIKNITNNNINNIGNITNNNENNNSNNIGLIIKTTKQQQQQQQNTNKIVKLLSTENTNDKIKLDGNSVKMSLPSLVNLGILTPATSPKLQTTISHQINNNNHIHCNNNNNNNNSQQINNNSNGNNDNLPLTPVSPNMSKTINFTATSAITTSTISSSTIVFNNNNITKITANEDT